MRERNKVNSVLCKKRFGLLLFTPPYTNVAIINSSCMLFAENFLSDFKLCSFANEHEKLKILKVVIAPMKIQAQVV